MCEFKDVTHHYLKDCLILFIEDSLYVLPSYQWQSAEPWSWLDRPGAGYDDGAPGEGPGKNKPGGSSSLALSNTHELQSRFKRCTEPTDLSQFLSLPVFSVAFF